MFTGIIECLGTITKIEKKGTNASFFIKSPLTNELKVDQSVAHNGVCLTIEHIENNIHKVTAIEETLLKTNLCFLKPGDAVNIERCLPMNGRIDGHIVQGHVDCTATCLQKKAMDGSWEFIFQFPEKFAPLVIDKGSICVNGISLTCFNVTKNTFTVAIIPYTYEHTNIGYITENDSVNIEFDIIGKYLLRLQSLNR